MVNLVALLRHIPRIQCPVCYMVALRLDAGDCPWLITVSRSMCGVLPGSAAAVWHVDPDAADGAPMWHCGGLPGCALVAGNRSRDLNAACYVVAAVARCSPGSAAPAWACYLVALLLRHGCMLPGSAAGMRDGSRAAKLPQVAGG